MEEHEYKVVRLLDELLPQAATPQRSGVSFDVRLYLREDSNDGHLWAEVAFIDRSTGMLLNSPETALPLAHPDDVARYFGFIAEKGFPLALELRTQPRRPQQRS
jgi:hypothetical protein